MTGKYLLNIKSKKIEYEFTIDRKITIITGNSATGKTTLIDLIEIFHDNKSVKLKCITTEDSDSIIYSECVTYSSKNIKQFIAFDSLYNNAIIFIDEDIKFVKSKQFADIIANSNNYFVIITRDELKMINYSIKSIYSLERDLCKESLYLSNLVCNTLEQVYKTDYLIYNNISKIIV